MHESGKVVGKKTRKTQRLVFKEVLETLETGRKLMMNHVKDVYLNRYNDVYTLYIVIHTYLSMYVFNIFSRFVMHLRF
jgi:hypothetical protein